MLSDPLGVPLWLSVLTLREKITQTPFGIWEKCCCFGLNQAGREALQTWDAGTQWGRLLPIVQTPHVPSTHRSSPKLCASPAWFILLNITTHKGRQRLRVAGPVCYHLESLIASLIIHAWPCSSSPFEKPPGWQIAQEGLLGPTIM